MHHLHRPLARVATMSLLALVAACAPPVNPAEEALKPFAGGWSVVSLDRVEKRGNSPKDMSVTVEGDKFVFTEMYGPELKQGAVAVRGNSREEYILQVNPAKGGEIDFVCTAGDDAGKTRPGLFAFDGKSLKICLAAAGKPRPTQIAAGDGLTVFALERQS